MNAQWNYSSRQTSSLESEIDLLPVGDVILLVVVEELDEGNRELCVDGVDLFLCGSLVLDDFDGSADDCGDRTSVGQESEGVLGETTAVEECRRDSSPFLHKFLIRTDFRSRVVVGLVEEVNLAESDDWNEWRACLDGNLHEALPLLQDHVVLAGSRVESLLCTADNQNDLKIMKM